MSQPAPHKPKKTAGVAGLAGIIAAVIAVEGGYVDHKDDPGGATKYGVTERVARANGYRGDMRNLTKEQATQIYIIQYVEKPGFDGVAAISAAVGEEIIDQGVNMGPRRPGCYLQTALNSLNRQQRDYPDLVIDCAVGPATVAAFGALSAKRGNRKACELVVKLADAQQASEYIRLTKRNPKLESFMPGWTDHRIGNIELRKCADGGV